MMFSAFVYFVSFTADGRHGNIILTLGTKIRTRNDLNAVEQHIRGLHPDAEKALAENWILMRRIPFGRLRGHVE